MGEVLRGLAHAAWEARSAFVGSPILNRERRPTWG
jgi:hypothetical protein